MKRCCTGLALLVLLAGCGGGGSPSAPVNGLAVMVSATGYLTGLTSGGGPTGRACGRMHLDMTFRETRGGTVQATDHASVITDSAGARTQRQGTFRHTVAPYSDGWVHVFFAEQCFLMPASWDFRVNTTDAAGTVTQLHGSGQVGIRTD